MRFTIISKALYSECNAAWKLMHEGRQVEIEVQHMAECCMFQTHPEYYSKDSAVIQE